VIGAWLQLDFLINFFYEYYVITGKCYHANQFVFIGKYCNILYMILPPIKCG